MSSKKGKIVKYTVIGLIPILIIVFVVFYMTFKDPNFYIDEIPENLKKKIIMNGVWNQSCPVPLNRLKIVNIKYYDKNRVMNRDGQFLVLDVVSNHALSVFRKLYKKKFSIEKIDDILIHKSHQESRIENISMGFICDSNDDKSLLYSYGMAFDINPLYNPALKYTTNSVDGSVSIKAPGVSRGFINRGLNFRMKNEEIASIFHENGFSNWGGNWIEDMNWQYFSVDKNVASLLFSMRAEDAEKFFNIVVDNIEFIDRFKKDNFTTEIKYLYQNNGRQFLTIFGSNVKKLKNLSDSQFFDLLRKKINN